MSVTVEVVNASGERGLPLKRQFKSWITAALTAAGHTGNGAVSVRIVDEQEGASLNQQYRTKGYATNVLSFPVPSSLQAAGQLGDIALCASVIKREAREQHKAPLDHWAHLAVHGALHLLGHDHEHKQDASIMEALEIRILADLGIKDPYRNE